MAMKVLAQARRLAAQTKGFVVSRVQYGLTYLAYRRLAPKHLTDRLIADFWERMAVDIHEQWGNNADDHMALQEVIVRYQPQSILDFGCGTGRLFSLYRQCGVQRVTGVDISATALEIARRAFPDTDLQQLQPDARSFPEGSFDLAICNRVLQHIPESDLQITVNQLCSACQRVYVNELMDSDRLDATFWMTKHNYRQAFESAGYACLETGQIGAQTYFVFGREPQEQPV